jgi:predicted nucleic acid-binding protein
MPIATGGLISHPCPALFLTRTSIAYKPANLPGSLLLSAIVLEELVAGAVDAEEVKRYDAARKKFEKEGRLLVPTGEDWYLAGKVLNSLLRGLKSKAGGKTPKLHPDEKARIVRGVLIARVAHRAGALLVTDNLDDFNRIKRFCNVRLQSGQEYFKREPGSE